MTTSDSDKFNSNQDAAASDAGARTAPPCVLALFGAGGDLTRRLLLPALANLRRAGLLPDQFAILALSRSEVSTDEFRSELERRVAEVSETDVDDEAFRFLMDHMETLRVDTEESSGKGSTFAELKERLEDMAERYGTAGNVLFYLATPPKTFGPIVEALGEHGLAEEADGWRRVVIEKPFGHDSDSARDLNRQILGVLREEQIYRMDHFLGKETVQNILALRFSNGIFEPLWTSSHVDNVQISVTETVGVEGRADFYDSTGALRDMVPNHVFQLLALTAMEAPTSFGASAVRREKVKVLEAVRSYDCENCLDAVVRGQYAAGRLPTPSSKDAKAEQVVGYTQEEGIDPESTTETFVAMKVYVDTWRWGQVPFYLRTGKRLGAKSSRVVIQFKEAPLALFRGASGGRSVVRNNLVIQLQPNEGISWHFGVKVPGPSMVIEPVSMDFLYKDHFEMRKQTGYETLLHDCMEGDPTLFQRADFVEEGWRIVDPILEAWQGDESPPSIYRSGTWGPQDADELLRRDGRSWFPVDD